MATYTVRNRSTNRTREIEADSMVAAVAAAARLELHRSVTVRRETGEYNLSGVFAVYRRGTKLEGDNCYVKVGPDAGYHCS